MSEKNANPVALLPVPKASLFDFDGVIVNSHSAHKAAWQSAAAAIWGGTPPGYPQELSGRAPLKIAEWYCARANDPQRTEEYMHLKLLHLLEQTKPPRLLPGVRKIFARLQRENIPFGIASNAPFAFVEATVKKHNLPVEMMTGVENYENPKPNPEPYFMLAKALGVSESDFSETLIFEDSKTGMQSAAATGMYAVGLRTSYSEAVLKEYGARVTLQDLSEATW